MEYEEYVVAHELHKTIGEIRAMSNVDYLGHVAFMSLRAERRELAEKRAK